MKKIVLFILAGLFSISVLSAEDNNILENSYWVYGNYNFDYTFPTDLSEAYHMDDISFITPFSLSLGVQAPIYKGILLGFETGFNYEIPSETEILKKQLSLPLYLTISRGFPLGESFYISPHIGVGVALMQMRYESDKEESLKSTVWNFQMSLGLKGQYLIKNNLLANCFIYYKPTFFESYRYDSLGIGLGLSYGFKNKG